MKILMLVNWKVEYCNRPSPDKQPPDYFVPDQPYWFFRYFKEQVQVDVVDISSFSWLERFEKNGLRFYIIQTLRAIPKLKNYDLIISHGMQSGVVLCLYRRFFKTKAKHLVFEIGSFNSAAESGKALKLMKYASKSIDGMIYHTSAQREYYQRQFPWLLCKSEFIPFGADVSFFDANKLAVNESDKKITMLCIGYAKRDWQTLISAFQKVLRKFEKQNKDLELKIIGNSDVQGEHITAMPYIPVKQLMIEIIQADFCILPLESFLYSYGQMTLLQQMAMGKAVIAARVPSLVDYGRDDETILFYHPQDSDDLAEKMEILITDEEKRNQIALTGMVNIRNEYSEEAMAIKVEKFIQTIREHSLCK